MQVHDLSKQMPEKLHELQRLWTIEASRNNVLPMDDRTAERHLRPRRTSAAGGGRVTDTLPGNERTERNGIININIKNKSHTITAGVLVPGGKPCQVTILSQGGFAGRWILYVKDRYLKYCYNFGGLQKFTISSTQPLTSGEHQQWMEFVYANGGLAKGTNVNLYIDGNLVGSGRVERTMPMVLSADETSDVGMKRGSPITPDLPPQRRLHGHGATDSDRGETQGRSRPSHF